MPDVPPRSPLLFRRWRFPGARPYHGGATVNPETGERYEKKEGHGVGASQSTAAQSSIFGRNRVAHEKAAQQRLARRHGAELRSGYYVGSWRSGGKVHYDPSEVIADFDTAMTKAKERKQKAIWDFANQREIAVT